jgi:hypothetical protein
VAESIVAENRLFVKTVSLKGLAVGQLKNPAEQFGF